MPKLPPPLSSSQLLSSSPPQSQVAETSSQHSTVSTQYTNKENAPPDVDAPPGSMPPQLESLLASIMSTLSDHFTKYPPHTIQRLAELILYPRQHYRNLPAYLHAVDRVVHVTSGAHIFPLPPAVPDPTSAVVLSNGAGVDPFSVSWGNRASVAPHQVGLGSDESLGGALLTPISWLSKSNGNTHSPLEGEVKTESTEMIEGPNGLGGIETVSVSVNGISSTRGDPASPSPPDDGASLRAEGGVTQGELLRQEQRAGVVPVTQLEGNRSDADGMGEEDEIPHARGPEEIGMEDMGPQGPSSSRRGGPNLSMQAIDVEAAVGRKVAKEVPKAMELEVDAPTTPKREAEEEIGADEKRPKVAAKDEDVGLVEADVKIEEDKKMGDEGKAEGADAVDSSTV